MAASKGITISDTSPRIAECPNTKIAYIYEQVDTATRLVFTLG